MHMCISKLTNIGADNGMSPGQCQAIIWANAGILLIQSLGTYFSEILNEIHCCENIVAKCRQFYLGLNVLTHWLLGRKMH